MNELRLSKINALAITAVLAVSGIAAAQSAANGARTDGQIESDVVQALDASEALKNDLITAATIQGAVTLSGTVASDSDRQLAESVVKKIPGVTQVKNNLRVGDPAQDPNATPQADNSAPPVSDDQVNDQANEQHPAPPQYGNQQSQNNQQPQYNEQQPAAPQYGQQQAPQPGYGNQQSEYGQAPPPPGYGQPGPQYGDGRRRPPFPPPGYRQPYAQAGPNYAIAPGPITVAPGAVLQVRTNEMLDNKHAQEGTPVDFVVIRDVLQNGYLAIPRGATVRGVVTFSKGAGQLSGSPELALRLTSLEMEGRSYPLDSDEFRVKGPNKTGHTVGNAIGGALIGAIIGGAVGGGTGAGVGAVVGGGAGTAASAASNPNAWIPAEALVTFHLNTPLTVDPVSRDEAMRLAQGLYPGGPTLYERRHVRGPGYYAYPAPYGYPPVYYRPYVMVGGGYVWR